MKKSFILTVIIVGYFKRTQTCQYFTGKGKFGQAATFKLLFHHRDYMVAKKLFGKDVKLIIPTKGSA